MWQQEARLMKKNPPVEAGDLETADGILMHTRFGHWVPSRSWKGNLPDAACHPAARSKRSGRQHSKLQDKQR